MSGTYNLGYTSLPTFTANSIGYVDVSANNLTYNPGASTSYTYHLIGNSVSSNPILLNNGVYIFTSTIHSASCTGTINCYLTLSSTTTFNTSNSICTASNSNNANVGVIGLNCCHIFYVNGTKPYLDCAILLSLGQANVTITYSYSLCRIA
jgi:hypothetical protein